MPEHHWTVGQPVTIHTHITALDNHGDPYVGTTRLTQIGDVQPANTDGDQPGEPFTAEVRALRAAARTAAVAAAAEAGETGDQAVELEATIARVEEFANWLHDWPTEKLRDRLIAPVMREVATQIRAALVGDTNA